jgi:hypothetical protein
MAESNALLQCQQCKARLQLGEHEAGLRFSGSGSGLSAPLEESFLVLGSGYDASSAGKAHSQAVSAPSGDGIAGKFVLWALVWFG